MYDKCFYGFPTGTLGNDKALDASLVLSMTNQFQFNRVRLFLSDITNRFQLKVPLSGFRSKRDSKGGTCGNDEEWLSETIINIQIKEHSSMRRGQRVLQEQFQKESQDQTEWNDFQRSRDREGSFP